MIATAFLKILHGDFRKQVQLQEDCTQHKKGLLMSGRQIAFMIYSHVKIRDVQSKVIGLNDLLTVELTGDNLRVIDTLWDDTLITMEKEPETRIL